ncbi:MAG: alpha-amylase family glycosyl hydrolase [Oscillospiraceae bacterium]|nr:alpha-amylase family glycosyl hydrolase [Oscillospiraceae bacterium]
MNGLRRALLLVCLVCLLGLTACSVSGGPPSYDTWQEALAASIAAQEPPPPAADAAGNGLAWYQVFVYSFYDSDGDGIGDLRGVTERLDYIQGMGFDGIWLSPIHPSGTYHKYNVLDYLAIDPLYGTMEDFDALIAACRERGLKVLLDLVVNHTDLRHPWFTERPEFYNIAAERGSGGWARLPDGRWYECQFWDQMPDLDLLNLELRAELEAMFAFWLERGADGFRLDAVKEYMQGSTAGNVEVLSWLTGAVKRIKPDAYIVGEAWDTTAGLYEYYDSGIDSLFAFPFAGADGSLARLMLRADVTLESYLNRVAGAQEAIRSRNPNGTDAPFFTNHDMPRAAGFLRRDPNMIKTAWGLSLMQPGDAFVYYGEELGMSGSGKDENKRAPMLWTDAGDADGMTLGPPDQEAQSHSFAPAVDQIGDPDSIYTYIRDAVRLRRKYPHIGRGSFEVLPAAGPKAGAVRREWQGSEIWIAYNVSAEAAELTLPGALKDFLSATGEPPEQQGDTLILPGYCIAVLAEG